MRTAMACGLALVLTMSAQAADFLLLQDNRTCRALQCSAARGEFEPVQVTVLALQDVTGLRVEASCPGAAVDVRVVKAWWQAGHEVWDLTHKKCVDELLLKDDGVVAVDLDKGTNTLRDKLPQDAATLQPVNIPEGASRTFWLTVRPNGDAASGKHRGVVAFSCAGRVKSLPLRVNVRAFDLAPSKLLYSIYYRAHLQDGPAVCNSDDKTAEQYRVEIADMRDHGVLYPANYQGFEGLERALQIRHEEGLPTGRFFTLGANPGSTPEALDNCRKWMAALKPWGYNEVYFYGEDEATGEQLLAQKAGWAAAQAIGAKTFVAGYAGTFEAMGGLLNCAVYFGRPTPEEAAKWHGVGSMVLSYANPQVGVEDALIYRRNYGLALWRSGFDGAMDYAYQHAFHDIWNDLDDPEYRDHCFAYPTVNGVVGTVQWEGFREGVDDTRYIATLQDLLPQTTPDLAAQATRFLNRIDVGADPGYVREKVAEWIEKLNADVQSRDVRIP